MGKAVTASLTAENTFTDWISPKEALSLYSTGIGGFLNISISGTWVGTITLQRRFGESDSARDVTDGSFTTNVEKGLFDHETTVQYRIGFKTGGYTSGTAVVRLGA